MNEKAAGGLKHIKSIFKRKKDKDGPSNSYQGDAGPSGPPPAQSQPEGFPTIPNIPMPQQQQQQQQHQQPLRLNEDNIATAQKQEAQQPDVDSDARSYDEGTENLVTRPIPHDEEPPPPPPPPKDDVDLSAAAKPAPPAKDEEAIPEQRATETQVPEPEEDVSKQEQEEARRDGVTEAQPDDDECTEEPGQAPKPKMSATSGPLEDIPAFVH